MMKKFTSFLTLLICFCCGAFAQDVNLEKSSITLGEFVEEFDASTWYLLYQRRGGDGYAHYENETTRFYKRATSFGQDPLTDGESGAAASKWLLRFVPAETDGLYYIQFANGAFWVSAGTGNGAAVNPGASKYDATEWCIYRINEDGVDGAGNPVFAIAMGSKTGKLLDNNGNGGTLSMWGNGELTDVESNAAWSIRSVEFEVLDEREAAQAALNALLNSYIEDEFVGGTAPGNYGEAEVSAYEELTESAWMAVEDESKTAEELEKLAQDLEAAHQAVLDSRVPFAVAITPGYYYITSALDFTETITTPEEEDPETGETIGGDTTTEHVIKGMRANGTAGRWNTLDREDANYLWKITEAGDKTYTVTNCQTDAQFNQIATSAAITLSTEANNPLTFDFAGAEGLYNIRLTSQAERDYFYIHCGNHGGGSGKNGNLVGWCTTYENGVAAASEWKLEAVDEATALAIIEACSPAKLLKSMTDSAAVIIATAPGQIEIAKDVKTKIYEDQPFITSVDQLDDCGFTSTAEGSLEGMIDGNPSTYWHTTYAGGNLTPGSHYFIAEAEFTGSMAIKMTRRSGATNDHVSQITIYAENSETGEMDEENAVAVLNFPYTAAGETLVSDVFTLGQNTGKLKFVVTETAPTSYNRGYFHIAEFQVYPAEVSTPYATNQYAQRNSEATALENAIAAWQAIDMSTVQTADDIQAEFNTLTTAWETWKKVYVDPAALREAIANAPDTKVIKIGNNPGEWKDASGTITGLVSSAQAYDEACLYTPEQSQAFIDQLAAAGDDMFAAANKIETGKWYRFRFATEEEYEENGWDKTGAKNRVNEQTETELSLALFGKYVVVATSDNQVEEYVDSEGEEAKATVYRVKNINTDEEATFGHNVYYMSKDDIENADMALWRFVAVGDSAYAIQNKATGLYIRTSGSTGAVNMNVQPMLFEQKVIGYGKNLLAARSMVDGASSNYLHAQRDGNMLVTWNADAIESNSCLYIEEAEAVTEEPTAEFTMSMWPGEVKTVCYPAAIASQSNNATFYAVSYEENTVTLNPIEGNAIKAGEPAVLIYGDVEDYEEIVDDDEDPAYNADSYELATFTHGTEFAHEPIASGALTGSYVQKTIGSGNLWAEGNTFVLTKKSNNTLGANTAYVDAKITDLESTISFVIETESVDAIAPAVAKVSKIGGIYTIDGKFIGNGNLNSLKNLPKNIYIVNGVKVTVK